MCDDYKILNTLTVLENLVGGSLDTNLEYYRTSMMTAYLLADEECSKFRNLKLFIQCIDFLISYLNLRLYIICICLQSQKEK